MNLISEELHIEARASTLWSFMASIENLTQWVPQLAKAELLGSQATGIGRRQRLTFADDTVEWSQEQVMIAWEPGRRIGWRVLHNQFDKQNRTDISDLQTIFLFKAIDHSTTLLCMETSWISENLQGRLYSQFSLKPAVRRQSKQTLNALARLGTKLVKQDTK